VSASCQQLIQFLQKELGLSLPAIHLGLRRQQEQGGPLPIILYQLGLIDVVQVNRLYEWTWTS